MPAKHRKKPPPQTTRDYLATFEHALRHLSYSQHLFTTFRHFVEASAIAFSNVADPSNKAVREEQYLAIVKQYKPEEFQKFPSLLGMLVACLEQESTDVLGVLYHRLELHNEQAGQFFTPYPVCQAMAKMLVHDAKQLAREQEFIRAHEPCVGSGAMVIALAQALREEGINYQQKLHVTAIDLDLLAVHMAYVHCTLLHIPALIVHGDTLRFKTYSVWRTFAHVMGLWDAKLARDPRQLPAPQKDRPGAHPAPTTDACASPVALQASTPPVPSQPDPIPSCTPSRHAAHAILAARRFPPMMSHDNYDGSVCPRCGTPIMCAVPPGTILAGKGALYVPLSCSTCVSSWEEVYTLTGYRDLQPDDTPEE